MGALPSTLATLGATAPLPTVRGTTAPHDKEGQALSQGVCSRFSQIALEPKRREAGWLRTTPTHKR
eukprot:9955002-Prorocentrum_lima.AAC.1